MSVSPNTDAVVRTYSEVAEEYDAEGNQRSCWGITSRTALVKLRIGDNDRLIVDVGCGTGRALAELAAKHPKARFIGIEPAVKMRQLALERSRHVPNLHVRDGRFESLPIESGSVDNLLSIMAFHWTTDVNQSIRELARVIKADGKMNLFFIGRFNGREFIRQTTPAFLKHMGPKQLLQAASIRKQLTRDEAEAIFARTFPAERLRVTESFDTYYDTLEAHWNWWIRIEGQFVDIPPEKRASCDDDVRGALSELQTDKGIPYTIHCLHVRLISSNSSRTTADQAT